jgi:hypothetical protein
MTTKLKDLLIDAPANNGIKIAAIEQPNKTQVEGDFGRLAYAFLKDRASGLLEYLVGFEVVEMEEDGSRAVGLFGFSIGNSFWYVPVFFINNQIKGMDLLYSKDEGSFVPLQESWINHILSKKTIEMGSPADPNVRKELTSPDFNFITNPPLGGATKMGSDGLGNVDDWCPAPEATSSVDAPSAVSSIDFLKDACDVWNTLQRDTIAALDNDSEFGKAYAGVVNATLGEPMPREKRASSELIDFLRDHGGPDAVATVLNTFENESFLKAATEFYDHRDLMLTEFSADLAPQKQAMKIDIVTEVPKDEAGPTSVTDDERTKIVRDGFVIKDQRTDDEKSEMYTKDYMSYVSNPDCSGKYRVISRTGALLDMYVLANPFASERTGMSVLIDSDSGRFVTADNNAIFTRSEADDAESAISLENELWDKGVDVKDMKVGSKYILVDDRLKSSLPFRVKSVTSEDKEAVQIRVDWHNRVDFKEDQRYEPGQGHGVDGSFMSYEDSFIIPLSRSGELRKAKNDLVVPVKSWKAFELEDRDTYDKPEGIDLAGQTDIHFSLQKESVHRLRVDCSDGYNFDVYLNDLLHEGGCSYKTASISLVRDYGLAVDDAESVLKEAASDFKSRKIIKMAQGVMMPMMPDQAMGQDAALGLQTMAPQIISQQGQTTGIPDPMAAGPGTGINLGGDAQMQSGQTMDPGMLPPDVQMLAEQAAASGQAQVFDHGVIGGLSKVYDVSSTVDSFVPDLLKSLDRIGRILFLFYWKNEEFAERYGDSDLTQMEDHIRSVFKQFGDLVIKLKQRTIEAGDDNAVPVGASV